MSRNRTTTGDLIDAAAQQPVEGQATVGKTLSKFRPNIIFAVAMGVILVTVLAVCTDTSGEAIAGLGGTMLGVIGVVCKELISADDSLCDRCRKAEAITE